MGGWHGPYQEPKRPWHETFVPKPGTIFPEPTPETDHLARSYANFRIECAELEDMLGSAQGLTEKDLKRLDKAVTVMKVAFKIIAKVLRKKGYVTSRTGARPQRELSASAESE